MAGRCGAAADGKEAGRGDQDGAERGGRESDAGQAAGGPGPAH